MKSDLLQGVLNRNVGEVEFMHCIVDILHKIILEKKLGLCLFNFMYSFIEATVFLPVYIFFFLLAE